MFIIIYLSTDYHQRDKFNLDKRYSAEEKVDKNKKFESQKNFVKVNERNELGKFW